VSCAFFQLFRVVSAPIWDFLVACDASGSPFQKFSSFNQAEPQPVSSSSLADDTTRLPASDTNSAKPSSEAPEAFGPAPAPQPRSWFASLSRRSSSSTPLNELAKQTPPLAAGERPTTPDPVAPPPADPSPAPATSPVSDPQVASHAAQPEVDVKSIPSKRPWFTSSSSSKRPSKLRPMGEPEPANDPNRTDSPAPETPQPPVTNVIPPTPPKTELSKVERRPPPESVSVPSPTSRKWLSPVSSLPSRSPDSETRTTSPSAVSQVGVASPSTPSSIDDQVPKLPSAGPRLESVEPSVLLSSDASQNLSALNPSASRFTLSIPFLGRPKVPLDRAVASAKATDIRTDLGTEGSSSRPSGEDTKTEGEETTIETTGKNSVPRLLSTRNQHGALDTTPLSGPSSESATTAPQMQSWWGLVGWGPTITQSIPQAQDTLLIETLAPDQEQNSIIADSQPRGTDVSNTPSVQAQPESTISAETDENRSSSWLSPWSWSYSQPIPAPNPALAKDGIDGQAQAPNPSSADASVKEAPETPTVQIELTNPIQSSIATNVSGWASFFASKTLLAKRITDTEYREESTMEVMVIDDGDEERASTATLVATSETRTRNEVGRETQVAPPRTPSPSPKPNGKPDKKPDELQGTKRVSVSPAPSKGSGSASPRVPSAPNLVLPTWEDTFCSPPRSTALRSQTSSALSKTLRFVSGMFFARDDGTSSGKGKMPSNDDGSFADFGRDLPRSWDVTGESFDSNILRGCRRVVVIGIHGWFPGTYADVPGANKGSEADTILRY
jgi:hypothetical protein